MNDALPLHALPYYLWPAADFACFAISMNVLLMLNWPANVETMIWPAIKSS